MNPITRKFIVNGKTMFAMYGVSDEFLEDNALQSFKEAMLVEAMEKKCRETLGEGTLTHVGGIEYKWTKQCLI